jgi:folate-dependent phosphoribosylglycinamide formyltransferase PurN
LLNIGWFSTGRGGGSRGLLEAVIESIKKHGSAINIEFVFCNREMGETKETDIFLNQVRDYGIPLVTLSSQNFRKRNGGGPFSAHRDKFDEEVASLLLPYRSDIAILAGYMLIASTNLLSKYTMLNLHPALPDGPIGTWQEAIWHLIEERSSESGGHIHVATQHLDKGPVITYYSFPLTGPIFDPLWRELGNISLEQIKSSHGESAPLFQAIRNEGVKRERSLLVETLRAISTGQIHVENGIVTKEGASPSEGISMNHAINRTLVSEG